MMKLLSNPMGGKKIYFFEQYSYCLYIIVLVHVLSTIEVTVELYSKQGNEQDIFEELVDDDESSISAQIPDILERHTTGINWTSHEHWASYEHP